jgi:hypothetical protein
MLSYIIDACLSLDGTKFEGMWHNVDKGLEERVTGVLQRPRSPAEKNNLTKHRMKTESLLYLSVCHLSLNLCSQTALSNIDKVLLKKVIGYTVVQLFLLFQGET